MYEMFIKERGCYQVAMIMSNIRVDSKLESRINSMYENIRLPRWWVISGLNPSIRLVPYMKVSGFKDSVLHKGPIR